MEGHARYRNQKPLALCGAARTRGAALFGALVVTLIVSMLGTVSFRLASQEVENVRAMREEAVVKHLAEAGIDLVVQLFHDPAKAVADPSAVVFQKRFDLPDGGPSFFDAQGRSQFRGSAATPDLIFDAANAAQDRVMNDPVTGWFRSLQGLGRILRLKIYGPAQSTLLCTAEVSAIGPGGLKRTIAVQLGTRRIPAIRAAAQLTGNGLDAVPARGLPIWVHWGDLKIRGDTRLPKIEDLPGKTLLAAVSALSYKDMFRKEDRWQTFHIGGMVSFMPSAISPPPAQPSHVLARQEPLPGLKEDRWSYDDLKQHAMMYGEYYVRGLDGLLYRDGRIEGGAGVSLAAVMRSAEVGDHRGVVFVDTLDQKAPRSDNLGTLLTETDYAEGVFIVNAKLKFIPRGNGQAVPALSPPNDDPTPMAGRVPVALQGIHLNGILSVAGDFTFEGHPRMFGALMTGGQVIAEGTGAGPLELWADYELRQGLVRGMPLVFVASGTWQES